MRDYMMIQADQALDNETRQADVDAGLEAHAHHEPLKQWDVDWVHGFSRYVGGEPYSACTTEAERRGWKCAKRTEWMKDATVEELEAAGA